MMAIDQVTGVLLRSVWVEGSAKAFGHCDRPGILWIDIADKTVEAEGLSGPVPQRRSCLRRVASPFVRLVDKPAEILLRVSRPVADADLPDTIRRRAKVDHQRTVPEQRPPSDFMAEHPPRCPQRVGSAHARRAR